MKKGLSDIKQSRISDYQLCASFSNSSESARQVNLDLGLPLLFYVIAVYKTVLSLLLKQAKYLSTQLYYI